MIDTVDTSKEAVQRDIEFLACNMSGVSLSDWSQISNRMLAISEERDLLLGQLDDCHALEAQRRQRTSDVEAERDQLRREVEEARDKLDMTDLVVKEAVKLALDEAEKAAVIPCYESRHVTLGDKVASAISALKARP